MLINLYAINQGYRKVTVADKRQLNQALGQLHHATQFVAMAGKAFLSHLDDDSHNNMFWDANHNAQVGRTIRGKQNFNVALLIKDFALAFIDNDNEIVDHQPLDGMTMTQTMEWMKAKLEEQGKDINLYKWDLHYDIPVYPYDEQPYQKPADEVLSDIAAYRTNANAILGNIAMKFDGASEVRIWPHHYDTGIYIPYEKDDDGKDTKGIFAGWNMADEHVDEPYYYITFFPYKQVKLHQLPALISKGYWHTKAFLGVFMKSTKLASIDNPKEQLHQCKEFFEEGVDKAIRIIKLA